MGDRKTDAKQRREERARDLAEPAQEGATVPADADEAPRVATEKGDAATPAQPPSPAIRREPDPDSTVPTAPRPREA